MAYKIEGTAYQGIQINLWRKYASEEENMNYKETDVFHP